MNSLASRFDSVRVSKYLLYRSDGLLPAHGPALCNWSGNFSKVKPDLIREKLMQLTNPFIELGIQRGREEGIQQGLQQGVQEGTVKGRQQGEVEFVLRQLKRRLGTLPGFQEKAIRKLELSRIEALGEALLEFTTRADLTRWLRKNALTIFWARICGDAICGNPRGSASNATELSMVG